MSQRAAIVPEAVTVGDVYRNLHTGTWSVKAVQAPRDLIGKVVAHPTQLVVVRATFRVNAKGRDLVRSSCSKNVHSLVRGSPAPESVTWPSDLVVDVGYNPYLFDGFVILSNGAIVKRAAVVEFPLATKGGRPLPLKVALYPEDAYLVSLPAVKPGPDRLARMAWCRMSPAERKASRAAGNEAPVPNPVPTLRRAVLSCDWNGNE